MAIGDGLLALLVLGFWLFCLFDVITTDESQMRNLSKTWWIVIVLFLTLVGSIMWLVAGRPQGAGAPGLPSRGDAAGTGGSRYGNAAGPQQVRRPPAPDDDPEFLERVRRQTAEDRDLLQRWEDDLRRREDELRTRPEDKGPGDGSPRAGGDGPEPTG
jgi:hypothetical protein